MTAMKFHTSQVPPVSVETALLLVGVFEDDILGGPVDELNTACGGALSGQADVEGFKGKIGQTMVHYGNHLLSADRVLLFGLGNRGKLDLSNLRKALTAAYRKAKKLKVDEVTIAKLSLDGTRVTGFDFGQAVAEYAGLVDYVINHQKTEKGGHKADPHLGQVKLLASAGTAGELKAGVQRGRVIASAVNNARDLVNMPPAQCTPRFLANEAQKLARKFKGTLTVRVLNRAQARKLGMNSFLAVGQGSAQEPLFIEISYEPTNAVPGLCLGYIGKSITFDSGGLDIKTGGGMRYMKGDMAGGAAVLSAIGAIAALQIPVRVKAFMAATENMPDGNSYKAGDVLKTMAGLTVEVDNTDAEGRLTLVDAVEYARRIAEVTHIVDLATLTGAIRQTCAHIGAGAFSNDDTGLLSDVLSAAASVDEKLWPMPMWPELEDFIKSDMADLKNTGGTAGAGSSTAALFIGKFAEGIPWVHLDIASVSHRDREFGADPAGGTGFGVRTLIALAELAAQSAAKAASQA